MKYKFDWDQGNLFKLNVINAPREITKSDVESVFRDPYAFTKPAEYRLEKRWQIIGRDLHGRLITVIFTRRKSKIRYVTAWKVTNKKEDYKTYLKRL